MNKILLIGRLTKNPELRYTTSNIAVAQLSLAVTRNYKNQEGDYEADFFNCIAYKKQAETIAQYLQKGDQIGIEGKVRNRSYDDKEGNKRYVTEVIIDTFDFLQMKKKEETPSNDPFEKVEEKVNDPFADFSEEVSFDNDLPW